MRRATTPLMAAATPLLLLLLLLAAAAPAPAHAFPRPQWRQRALMTRWLAHEATYGVLATVAPPDAGGEGKTAGAPVGGVVSVADSPPAAAEEGGNGGGAGAGRLYLYLSPMDELTQNIAKDPRVSLTLTQASTSTGCERDPEDPTCARASFLGEAKKLSGDDEAAAKDALFAKHPAMKGWPDDHSFGAYEVVVREAHLLDYYGGMAVINAADYYGAAAPPDAQVGGTVAASAATVAAA